MVSCPPTHLTGVKRLATGITMNTTDLGVIYRYVNLINDKGYTGWTTDFDKRQKAHKRMDGRSPAFHNAIAKYGIDNFRCDILEHNALIERECFWIATFGDFGNGYNLTEGGYGIDSETAREAQRKRVTDGTHHFLGGDMVRKRVADGTHHFLGSEYNRKRVTDGIHPFLGGKIQRETNRKRVADGTHHLLAKNRCPETEKRRREGHRKYYARKRHEKQRIKGKQLTLFD